MLYKKSFSARYVESALYVEVYSDILSYFDAQTNIIFLQGIFKFLFFVEKLIKV